MGDQLTDRQLAIAAWMYERRVIFERSARVFSGVCLIGLFGALIAAAASFFVSYRQHQLLVLEGTQNAIIAGDPALSFSPVPLSAASVIVLKGGDRSADLASSIMNQNAGWAAFSVRYYFTSGGAQISEPRETFALPGDNPVVGFARDAPLAGPFALVVENPEWRKIVLPIERERVRLFLIESRDAVFTPGDTETSSVEATVVNKSPFGFWNVVLAALLYNNDSLVGVGEYTLPQFAAGEERSVSIGVGVVSSPVTSIRIVPRVNVLNEQSLVL